ncbi:MAG: hypothetical protein WA902_13910 [Thermosynechococcaceae cyanobacterium]
MLTKILSLGLAVSASMVAAAPALAQSAALRQAQQTNNPNELYLLGQKELARFNFDDAIAIFTKAIQRSSSPSFTELARLGLFTTYKVAGVSKVDTFPHEAIPMLKAAIKMEPRDAFLYSRLGDAYCHSKIKKYTTCLHFYNEGVRVTPDKAQGYFSRGIVRLNRLNEKSLAYDDFRRAINAALTRGDQVSAKRYLEYAVWMGMPVPK